jgi:hypothetical protein
MCSLRVGRGDRIALTLEQKQSGASDRIVGFIGGDQQGYSTARTKFPSPTKVVIVSQINYALIWELDFACILDAPDHGTALALHFVDDALFVV